MIYRGRMHNGSVVFDQPTGLADGVPVEVQVVDPVEGRGPAIESPSLYDRLQDLIGLAQDFPSDAAQQIDHYLYGTPKRP